jgi:hypothetical protein
MRKRQLVEQLVSFINVQANNLDSTALEELMENTKQSVQEELQWQNGHCSSSDDEDDGHVETTECDPYVMPHTFKPEAEKVDPDGKKIPGEVDLPPNPSKHDHHHEIDKETRKELEMDTAMPWGAVYEQFMKYGTALPSTNRPG